MINNLTDFTKLEEVFFTSEEDLSHISQYGKSYHNSESSAKCPRCENLGELVEDGPVRCLYRCRDCGIFAKLTKKKRLDGLRRAIAALNRYRGDNDGIAGTDSQNDKGGRDHA